MERRGLKSKKKKILLPTRQTRFFATSARNFSHPLNPKHTHSIACVQLGGASLCAISWGASLCSISWGASLCAISWGGKLVFYKLGGQACVL